MGPHPAGSERVIESADPINTYKRDTEADTPKDRDRLRPCGETC